MSEVRDQVVAVRRFEQKRFAVSIRADQRIVAAVALHRHIFVNAVDKNIGSAVAGEFCAVFGRANRKSVFFGSQQRLGFIEDVITRAFQCHGTRRADSGKCNHVIAADNRACFNRAADDLNGIVFAEIRNKIILVRVSKLIQLAVSAAGESIITRTARDRHFIAVVDD